MLKTVRELKPGWDWLTIGDGLKLKAGLEMKTGWPLDIVWGLKIGWRQKTDYRLKTGQATHMPTQCSEPRGRAFSRPWFER